MSEQHKEYKLTEEQTRAIRKALAKGHRVELVPVKEGIKLMLVQRNELKTE